MVLNSDNDLLLIAARQTLMTESILPDQGRAASSAECGGLPAAEDARLLVWQYASPSSASAAANKE